MGTMNKPEEWARKVRCVLRSGGACPMRVEHDCACRKMTPEKYKRAAKLYQRGAMQK
jgi:hypothetical protein